MRAAKLKSSHQAAHQQHGALQAVGVFVAIGHRVLAPARCMSSTVGKMSLKPVARGRQRVAAAQRGLHQLARPDAFLMRLPELLAAIGLHPLDAGLAAAAAAPPCTGSSPARENRSCPRRRSRRTAPRARARPSGISTDGVRHVTGRLEPAMNGNPISRDVSYISFGPLPIPGEMLVVEDRHGAAARPKDLHDLLEEFVARILRLALLVLRIVAVLADQHHAVHGQFAAAERQRFGDGRIDLHAGRRAARSRLRSSLSDLVDVERHQIHGRMMMRAVPAVAVEKAVDDVLGVRNAEEVVQTAASFGLCWPRKAKEAIPVPAMKSLLDMCIVSSSARSMFQPAPEGLYQAVQFWGRLHLHHVPALRNDPEFFYIRRQTLRVGGGNDSVIASPDHQDRDAQRA